MSGWLKKIKLMIFLFSFPFLCYSSSLIILDNGKKPLSKMSTPLYDEFFFKNKKIYVFERGNESFKEWGWDGGISQEVKKGYYGIFGYAVGSKGKCQIFYVLFPPKKKHNLSVVFEKNKFIWKSGGKTLGKYYESGFDLEQNTYCYEELLNKIKV
jgi:hypothetical protein